MRNSQFSFIFKGCPVMSITKQHASTNCNSFFFTCTSTCQVSNHSFTQKHIPNFDTVIKFIKTKYTISGYLYVSTALYKQEKHSFQVKTKKIKVSSPLASSATAIKTRHFRSNHGYPDMASNMEDSEQTIRFFKLNWIFYNAARKYLHINVVRTELK